MSSSTVTPLLSQEAITILEAKQPTPLQNGRRVVSNVSYMSDDSIDSEASVEIPEYLESQATLEFLEFKPEVARNLWDKIQEAQTILPNRDFLDAVRFFISTIPEDAYEENNDEEWKDAVKAMGLTRAFEARLMDAAFREIRLKGSLKEWVTFMMEERFYFLQSLDAFVKNPARGINRRVSKMNLQTGKLTAGPAVPARTSSIAATPNFDFPSAATANSDPPSSVDECTTYFKGGSIARLESINLSANPLNFLPLTSTPPGDFSGDTRGLYFTKHEQIAWQYAQWAGKLVDGTVVPVGILQIAIPNHLLASMTDVVGENWRRFVWANRRTVENLAVPEDLDYLNDFQWLTGPICGQSQHKINGLRTSAELEVWKLPRGESATQIFTGKRAMMRLMGEHCIGKVWVTGISAKGR